MPKHGKNYAQALLRYDQNTAYSADEAIELVKMFSYAKFDETVEAAFRLESIHGKPISSCVARWRFPTAPV